MTRPSPGHIRIRGARVHNLQGVDVDLPRNSLIAITGPSGSGKSSLAFDTLFAEGQRRYVESLSAYARQFLQRLAKPEVESIEGLSPAIAIEQKSVTSNPRSTVGTITEIHDYLRLLFARAGQVHCPRCRQPVQRHSVQEMTDTILALPAGTRLALLSPLPAAAADEPAELLEGLRRQGFTRLRVDDEIVDLEDDPPASLAGRRLAVYVDRLVVRRGIRSRLADSLETTLRLSGGTVQVAVVDGDDLFFSERHACLACDLELPVPSPQLFSFNNPQGACPRCGGLGQLRAVDADRLCSAELSLRQGGANAGKPPSPYQLQMLQTLADELGFDLDTPFANLSERVRRLVLFGSGQQCFDFALRRQGMQHNFRRPFEGVVPQLERRYRQTGSQAVRQEIERLMTTRPCPDCGGSRLRPEALSVLIDGESIAALSALDVQHLQQRLQRLRLGGNRARVGRPLLTEIRSRLGFMLDVGLGYLTLERSSATLSGGEAQRIRLASQMGSALSGVLYVLDEPTIGLHPRDCHRLLDTLLRLRDLGNTVVVVEHDPETIRAADHVVDMGPGAGWQGGQVVAQGTPRQIARSSKSLTGAWLSGRRHMEIPTRRRRPRGRLRLRGARGRNLRNLDVDFPLGVFTCVTGVSGSGKSTLLVEILYRRLAQILHHGREKPGRHDAILGVEHIDKVINIDQSPIGRTPRSNPATYTGVFTPIRELFASLPEAKMRGYAPGRFSFNVKGGRCEACQGQGTIKIEMQFLPDIYIKCDVCKGRRYNRETLQVRYKGKNIADVLDMTVEEAMEFFAHIPTIRRKLQTLYDVGLGYIKLGQPAPTLSGGEAQRVKLARELSKVATGRTLYVLDEPSVGLHAADVDKLIRVLNRLVDRAAVLPAHQPENRHESPVGPMFRSHRPTRDAGHRHGRLDRRIGPVGL